MTKRNRQALLEEECNLTEALDCEIASDTQDSREAKLIEARLQIVHEELYGKRISPELKTAITLLKRVRKIYQEDKRSYREDNCGLDCDYTLNSDIIKFLKERIIMGTWTCTKCGKKWESDSDCLQIGKKSVCSDCYYDLLGGVMEDTAPIKCLIREPKKKTAPKKTTESLSKQIKALKRRITRLENDRSTGTRLD